MDDTRKTTDTLTADVDRARERVREIADTALEKGRSTWKELQDRGEDVFAKAQERGEEIWKDTQVLLRKHPGKSVGIALAAGVCIGVLMMLRRNGDA